MQNNWQSIVLPKWVVNKGITVYLIVLIAASLAFSANSIDGKWILCGVVSVFTFYFGSKKLSRIWSKEKVLEKPFKRDIFLLGFLINFIVMNIVYFWFKQEYGDAFGFENSDPLFYDELGRHMASQILNGNWNLYESYVSFSGSKDVADMGFGTYLGVVYALTGNSIYLARVLKCVYGALISVVIYKIAQRNFDEDTARLAAIFCVLTPQIWYYCCMHLKEIEMTFVGILLVDQIDVMLKTKRFSAGLIIPILALIFILFTLRAPLAIVAVLALLFSITLSSTRIISWGKKIIIGLLTVAMIGVTMGNRIQEQTQALTERFQTGDQQVKNENRATKKGGNTFAKYATSAVFAPLIFTIPFPTLVQLEGQDYQLMQAGGNSIKNVLSGFVILCVFMLLFSGNWREHMMPLAYMLGYLMVLALSEFAHSGRFHMPIIPLEMMFAAAGIVKVIRSEYILPKSRVGNFKKYKLWFAIWSVAMIIAGFMWQYIKLNGRGLA